MKRNLYVAEKRSEEGVGAALVQTITSPECLSASVLTICHDLDHSQIQEMVGELKEQSAAVNFDDLSRAESILIAQAHTLDGLFAKLAATALNCNDLERYERYMKLALKAQNQARATLQTLGELKAPKHIAFVRQANIGSHVQVNNDLGGSRACKNENEPNELMEVGDGKRLDGRTKGSTGTSHSPMATVAKKHRSKNRRG